MDKELNQSTKASGNRLSNIHPGNKSVAGEAPNNSDKVLSQTNNSEDSAFSGAATEEINRSGVEPQPGTKEESNNQTMGIP